MTEPRLYLVDTNSYIRVGKSSNVILGDHSNIRLRLVAEIADECGRSPRLQRICTWLHEPPHPQMRDEYTLNVAKVQAESIKKARRELAPALDDALEMFAEKRRARGDYRAVLSTPDKAVFYTAETLGYGVVTDELAMTAACKEFDVPHLTTLGLLKLLTAASKIGRDHVDAMVRFWLYENDAPVGWKKEYLALFGPPAPTFP